MTPAELIRQNAQDILAFLASPTRRTYGKILEILDLPNDKIHQAQVSELARANGFRRHFSRKKMTPVEAMVEPVFPEGDEIPEVEPVFPGNPLQTIKEAKVAYTYRPYASDAERFRIAWEAAGNLFAQIYFQEGK